MPTEQHGHGHVRFRRGFREHLPYFAANPWALNVWNWALLSRDHRSGRFVADRREIAHATGLPEWRVKRSVAFLSHGQGCACGACERLPAGHRPAYIRLVRGPFRGSAPVYEILRDDSQRARAAAGVDDATPTWDLESRLEEEQDAT